VRRARLAVAAGLVASAVVGTGPPAAAYDESPDCQDIQDSDLTSYTTTAPSLPLRAMEVDRAVARLHRLGLKAGAGVVVAVIDSGVSPDAPIAVAGTELAGVKQQRPSDYHGTAVAGLIAGKPRSPKDGGAVGIAPAAQIYDVRVYDSPDAPVDSPDQSPMTVENLRAGLDAVIAAAPAKGIRIVNMSLAVPPDDEIRAKVEQLWDMGVVVVAPTGNRAELPADMPAEFETHRAGEDAAPYVHPADYDHVLGVSATPLGADDADPTAYVLENSVTDVAAPTAGAISYSLHGAPCPLEVPATSYATAEVSGVLALLQSAYDEPVAASVRRLLTAANGRPDIPNTLVGAGEVEAFAALTRPMLVDQDGTDLTAGTVVQEPQVLAVPEEPEDVLASTRDSAVWWGLVGGGLLVLVVVLRPVLARRRRTVR
jgi:membrane-anchored mycosin MYCP